MCFAFFEWAYILVLGIRRLCISGFSVKTGRSMHWCEDTPLGLQTNTALDRHCCTCLRSQEVVVSSQTSLIESRRGQDLDHDELADPRPPPLSLS